MTRCERRTFNGLALVVSISGFAFLLMKYGMETDDPFALVNHPLQPYALDLHLIAAPFLLFLSGMLARGHIGPMLRQTRQGNRKSGLISLCLLAVMAVSGYLLQIVTHSLLYQASLVLHILSGSLFSFSFLVHVVRSLYLRRAGKTRLREVGKRIAA